MIHNYKQYNESIKSLLVGPTREELYNNMKDLPTWKIIEISIENDFGDGLILAFKKDNKLINNLINNSDFFRRIVREGKIEIVRVMLENGENPNMFSGDPLCRSVFNNDYNMVKLLLDYGADINKCHLELINRSKSMGFDEISDLLKQYSKKDLNEGIKHLLVGPTENEVLEQLKNEPQRLLNYSISNNFKKGIEIALDSGANIHMLWSGDLFKLFKIMNYTNEQIINNTNISKLKDYALLKNNKELLKYALENGEQLNADTIKDLFYNDFDTFEYVAKNVKGFSVYLGLIREFIRNDKINYIKTIFKLGCFDFKWFGNSLIKFCRSFNSGRKDIINFLINEIGINEGIK